MYTSLHSYQDTRAILSSSGSSDSSTVCHDDMQQAKRRHRPRGCRGGRKHRNKKERQRAAAAAEAVNLHESIRPNTSNSETNTMPTSRVFLPRTTTTTTKLQQNVNIWNHGTLLDEFQPTWSAPFMAKPSPVPFCEPTSILPPLPRVLEENICVTNKTADKLSVNPYALTPSKVHRYDRLEKQREAFGGSLFITSPRSFLLGKN